MAKRKHPIHIYAKELIDDKDVQEKYKRKDGSYTQLKAGIVSDMTKFLVAYQIIINDKDPDHVSNNLAVMRIIDKLLPQAYDRECELDRINDVSDAIDAQLQMDPLKEVDSYLKKFLDEFDEIFMSRMHKISDELVMRLVEIVMPQVKIHIEQLEAIEKEKAKTPAPEVVVVLPGFKPENDLDSVKIYDMFLKFYSEAYLGTGHVEKAFDKLKEIYPYLPYLPGMIIMPKSGPCAGDGEIEQLNIFEALTHCCSWLSDRHLFMNNPEAKAMLNVLQSIVKAGSLPTVVSKALTPAFINMQQTAPTAAAKQKEEEESVLDLAKKRLSKVLGMNSPF